MIFNTYSNARHPASARTIAPPFLAMALLVMILNGCEGWPLKQGDSSESLSQTDDKALGTPADQSTDAITKRVPSPNPYLSDPREIPPALKRDYDAALKAIEKKDWDTATSQLSAIFQQHPAWSGPAFQLGIIAVEQQQWQAAEDYFHDALRINANNVFAHNELGVLYRQLERYQDAERQYKMALSIWEDFDIAYYNLGILYDMYLDNPAGALSAYREYQSLQPESDRRVDLWIQDLSKRNQQTAANDR